MKHFSLSSALVVSGLMLSAAPAFAQNTGATTNNAGKAQYPAAATKQRTQSDPTAQYNFQTPGGQYSARPNAMKQRTDGEDVTGNNNFPAASK